MEIRERIVISLMASDEEMTYERAVDFWARWKAELAKNPEHFGDCTKEPQTCNRCLIEDYYEQADQIIPLVRADILKSISKESKRLDDTIYLVPDYTKFREAIKEAGIRE